MSVDPQYGTWCMSPCAAWNFEVTPRFMENLYTSDADRISNVGLNLLH